MALIEERAELPRITRFVHTAILSGIEGVSLGVALATSLYSSHLDQFVKTNQIEAKLRKEMLAVVILPSLLLPTVLFVLCLASARVAETSLNAFERRVRLLSPLCALGFVPFLLKPSLWAAQTLAFLLVTGLFSSVVITTVHLSMVTRSERQGSPRHTDLESLKSFVKAQVSPRVVTVLAALLLVTLALRSVIHTLRETSLARSAFNSEWMALHAVSATGVVGGWFGEKGWRAVGHFGLLGGVYSVVGSVLSSPQGLLFFRLVSVSFACLPLFWWSKRALGVGAAFVISAAYLSMPVGGMLASSDPFPVSVVIGVFFLAAYYLESGSLAKGFIFVLLGVALNEQLALWFSLLGVYLSRCESRRSVGLALAVSGLAYFLVVALFILPKFGIPTYALDKSNTVQIGVQNLGATLTAVLVNPAYALSRWFEAQNLEFWLALLVPLALLPFRGRQWLLWLGPVLLFSATATSMDANAQWRDPLFSHLLALGFLAVIATLQSVLHSSPTLGPIKLKAALIGWIAALAPCISMFGTLYRGH